MNNKLVLILKSILFIALFAIYCMYSQLVPAYDGLDYYYLTDHFCNESRFDNTYRSPRGDMVSSAYAPGTPLLFGLMYKALQLIPVFRVYDIPPYNLASADYADLMASDSYSLSLPQLLFKQSYHQYNDLILLAMFLTSFLFCCLGIYFSAKVLSRYMVNKDQFLIWLLALANPLILFNVFYLFNWATFIAFGLFASVLYVFIELQEGQKNYGFLLGVLSGLLFLVRYEFILLALGLFVYYCFFARSEQRALALKLLFGLLPFLGLFFIYNYYSTGNLCTISYIAVRSKTDMGFNLKTVYDFLFNPRSGVLWYDLILLMGFFGVFFMPHKSLRPFLWSALLVLGVYFIRDTGDHPSVLLFFAWTRYLIPFLPLIVVGIFFLHKRFAHILWIFCAAVIIVFALMPWRNYFYPAIGSLRFEKRLTDADFFAAPMAKNLLHNTEYVLIPKAHSPNGFVFFRDKFKGTVSAAEILRINNTYFIGHVMPIQSADYFTYIHKS